MTEAVPALFAEMELPGSDQAPEWVQLVPAGLIKGRDGRSFRLADPGAVVAASALGADLPIDYEHQIDDPSRRGADGVVKAAGWIKQLEVRADGIWGRVEWTETARNMIAAKEYRYLSPVLLHKQAGLEVVRILGASLVHRPNLELKVLSSEEPSQPVRSDPALPQIATALGLDAGAGLDTILATLREGQAPDPAQYMPIAEVTDLLRERNMRIATLSEQAIARRVEDAVKTGVITPGMRDWATALCSQDPDSFDTFVHSVGPVFGHLFKTREWKLPDANSTAGLGPDAESIAAQLGLPAAALR
jgi:phage I-like protein